MRIAVWHNLPFGGASRALYGHLTALKESGNYLEIWTSENHPENNQYFKEFGAINTKSLGDTADSMQHQYKNPGSISQTNRIIGLLKAFHEKCATEINNKGFDLVFVNSCSVTYMPFISEFLKIPSVIYLGEPYRWLYEAAPVNRWQAPRNKVYEIKKHLRDYMVNYSRRIQVRQEIESAKAYGKILVNSYYSKESVYKAYGIESEVCRLGVDTEKFSTSTPDKQDYVVSVGLLYHPKGADRAVYLLSRIKESIRPRLYWISNGCDDTYLSYILKYAQQLKVDLVPLINISDQELVETVSKARFMIYTPRLEPLGLAPLEANACGTWVIGIAEAGVRETISHGENGFLIDGINDDKFIEHAELFLKSKVDAITLGLKARTFVQRNWDYSHLKQNILRELSSMNISR